MTDKDTPPIFDELADLARTLGHTHRLVLLHHVADGERAVEQLAELSGLPVANTSQHLQQLRRAGLVETRRDGKRVLYRLGTGPIENVLAAMRLLVRHRREQIRQLLDDRDGRPERLETISREELLRRLRADDIVLLDVRDADEFAAGHVPGAISIPLAELDRRLSELPADKSVVAYCRGSHCVLSADAARILSDQGRAVRHFPGGFADWQDAGLDVEAVHYDSG